MDLIQKVFYEKGIVAILKIMVTFQTETSIVSFISRSKTTLSSLCRALCRILRAKMENLAG